MSSPFRIATNAPQVDISLLRHRDRAVLRILDRAEAATPRQLAMLVYGHQRIAQRRLLRLWQAGLLERAVVPRWQRGGAELAYRLSDRARRRLGDTATRTRGANRLGHTLDVVETICALVSANGDPRRAASPVRLWLDEPNAAAILGTPPYPDAVVALETHGIGGVMCLEVDEATQRRAVINAKLSGYRRLLDDHAQWLLMFVVPSATRARWLRTVAEGADPTVATRAWVTTLMALRADGLGAQAAALTREGTRLIRDLLSTSISPMGEARVGSETWIRLLGEGGIEDVDEGMD